MLITSSKSLLYALLGLLIGSACAEADGNRPQPPAATSEVHQAIPPPLPDRFKSVTFDAVRAPGPESLLHLRDLGVTHLTLISFGFQPGHAVPEIRLNPDARWFSESDRGIRSLARQAKDLGLYLILKPHIWVGDYQVGGQRRDQIAFDTEEDWAQWEAAYRQFILYYARLAAEVDAPLFVVGTELASVARTREAFWRRLIAEVRTLYGGQLTYAANWYEEYQHVPFWDALDYIGVQAYFELSHEDDPPVEALRAGWGPPRTALAHLSEQVGRPILFTEIGYRSVSYAAAQPWRWPSRNEEIPPDDALQARLYQAFFESVWHEPWFAGAILWKWHPQDQRRRALRFTPQNKPAEHVIRQWFSAGPPSTP